MCPKSTVNASHQIPKWPMSKTVKSPGNVSTTVFLSYLLSGTSLPFSSGTRIPCGDGFGPLPTQNFASVRTCMFNFSKYEARDIQRCKLTIKWVVNENISWKPFNVCCYIIKSANAIHLYVDYKTSIILRLVGHSIPKS